MKTRKYLFLFLVSIISLNINGQLKVKSNGKAIVGTELTISQDIYNVLTMNILGKGLYGSESKVAFGDFGSVPWSCNVLVGEYGSGDTDRLWLHGNQGTYLTCLDGSVIIGSYDVNDGSKFNFNTEVWSTGIKLTSDERLKTDIKKINNSMINLRKLNGVSYNLSKKESLTGNKNLVKTAKISDTAKLTDKEQKTKAIFDAYQANVINAKSKHLGLIAQDLQKVYPELVDKDSSGYYSVDYIGLIPVLIEALKELDLVVEAQNTQINDLITKLGNSTSKKVGANSTIEETNLLTYPVLDQNIPNPFNTATTIGFYLPNSISTANIYVYDMNGVQLKSYSVAERGKGNVTIQGSEFSAGMYLYAMIVDGKVIDTKRMILTK